MAADKPGIPEGFREFRRYQLGEMSHEEQHAFERRMLDDPALADAYEGFLLWDATEPHTDATSAALKDALKNRVGEREPRRMVFWPYAAAASILIGVGFFVATNFSRQNEKVALESVPENAAEHAVIRPAEPANEDMIRAESDKKKPAQPPLIAVAPSPPAAAPAAVKTPPIVDRPERLDLAEAIAADDQQEFEVAGEAGFSQKTVPAQTHPDSVAKPLQDYSSAFAAKRSGDDQVKTVRPTAVSSPGSAGARTRVATAAAQPVGGWEAFQKYVGDQTSGSASKGSVTVAFDVARDGTLSSFQAQGPDDLLDMAIGIIKKGPAWISPNPTDSSRTLRASFVVEFK